FLWRLLIGIGPQVNDRGPRCHFAGAEGNIALIDSEVNLPVVPAQGIQFPTLAKIEDLFPWPLLGFALQEWKEVIPIGVNLERLAVGVISSLELFDNVRFTSRRE